MKIVGGGRDPSKKLFGRQMHYANRLWKRLLPLLRLWVTKFATTRFEKKDL